MNNAIDAAHSVIGETNERPFSGSGDTYPGKGSGCSAAPPRLGGWLTLPAIGLCWGWLVGLVGIASIGGLVDQIESSGRQAEFPNAKLLLALSWLAFGVYLIFNWFAAVFFFQRRRTAPRMMVAFYAFGILWSLGLVWGYSSVFQMETDIGGVAAAIVIDLFWIGCFSFSERVKTTFVGEGPFTTPAHSRMWAVLIVLIVLTMSASMIRHGFGARANWPTGPGIARAQSNLTDPTRGAADNNRAVLNRLAAADTKLTAHWAQSLIEEAAQRKERYQQDMSQLCGDGLLQPDNLDTSDKLATTRIKIMRYRQLVDDFERDQLALLNSAPQGINALPMSNSAKQSVINGYQQTVGETRDSYHKIADIDRQCAALSVNVVDFLQPRLGTFKVAGHVIFFEKDTDLSQYNAMITQLQQLAATEARLIREAQQASQQSCDDIARMCNAAGE